MKDREEGGVIMYVNWFKQGFGHIIAILVTHTPNGGLLILPCVACYSYSFMGLFTLAALFA